MIEDSMGFLAFYDQAVNAGVGFQTMGDFDKLPNYLTLRPGYETLSDTLARQIREMGGKILLGHHVDSFDFSPFRGHPGPHDPGENPCWRPAWWRRSRAGGYYGLSGHQGHARGHPS
jgi:hypothetical protein